MFLDLTKLRLEGPASLGHAFLNTRTGEKRLIFNGNIVVKLIDVDKFSVKVWEGAALHKTISTWRTT
jgi:hypothetical protein